MLDRDSPDGYRKRMVELREGVIVEDALKDYEVEALQGLVELAAFADALAKLESMPSYENARLVCQASRRTRLAVEQEAFEAGYDREALSMRKRFIALLEKAVSLEQRTVAATPNNPVVATFFRNMRRRKELLEQSNQ